MGGEFEKTDSGMKPAEGVLIPHKKNTGMAVALVLLVVIVLGLSGFILMDKLVWDKDQDKTSNGNTNNSQVVSDVDELDEKDKTEPTDKLECDEGDTPANPGLIGIQDYIVLADMNLKIRKPAGHTIVYRVEPDTGSVIKGKISLSGQANGNGNWLDYGNFSRGGSLLMIERTADKDAMSDRIGSAPYYIGEVGGYHYWLSGQQQCGLEDQSLCSGEHEEFQTLLGYFKDLNNYEILK